MSIPRGKPLPYDLTDDDRLRATTPPPADAVPIMPPITPLHAKYAEFAAKETGHHLREIAMDNAAVINALASGALRTYNPQTHVAVPREDAEALTAENAALRERVEKMQAVVERVGGLLYAIQAEFSHYSTSVQMHYALVATVYDDYRAAEASE